MDRKSDIVATVDVAPAIAEGVELLTKDEDEGNSARGSFNDTKWREL